MRQPLAISFTLLFLFFSTTLQAWRIEKNVLIIEKGDNLWEIAHALHARGFDYPKIWKGKLDNGLTNNPSLIYDGMRFKLDLLPGQPGDSIGISEPGNPVSKPGDSIDTSTPVAPFTKPGDSSSNAASSSTVVNYFGEKEKEENSWWGNLFMKAGESFFEILLFPLILLLITRWVTRHDDERNKKFYLKLLMIFLAGLILYALVRNFHFNVTSGKIENIAAGPGIGSLLVVLLFAGVLIFALSFLWRRFTLNDSAKKENTSKQAGANNNDDGAYFEVAMIYEELREKVAQLKEYSLYQGPATNASRKKSYRVECMQLVKRIQSWMLLKGTLYLSYHILDDLNSRLEKVKIDITIISGDPENKMPELIDKELMAELKIIAHPFRKIRSNKNG